MHTAWASSIKWTCRTCDTRIQVFPAEAIRALSSVVCHFFLFTSKYDAKCKSSVAADFVFQKSLRTRISARCTEFEPLNKPVPVVINVENKQHPIPGTVVSHGSNTPMDDRGRLVHRSQYVPSDPNNNESPAEIQNSSSPEPTKLQMSEDKKPSPIRRSSRIRRPVDRLIVGLS